MNFVFKKLAIPEVVLIEPRVFRDERGYFLETYSRSDFEAAGLPPDFVQENHSHSNRGVLRGLHFQRAPKSQAKLIRVAAGEIFDVAVDIRPDSPTRGKWVSAILSSRNNHQLFIPAGFAHGFCVMSETADVTYLVTEDYSPEHEDGIIWNDPGLAIAWPIAHPLVAPRDLEWPQFEDMQMRTR